MIEYWSKFVFSFNSTFGGDGSTLSFFVISFTFSLATVYQITLILADTSRHRPQFIYSTTSSESKLLRQAGV